MKFTIRDLLLVTVIVALAVVAAIAQLDRQRLAKENDRLRNEYEIRIRETPGASWGPPKRVADDLPNSSAPAANPPKP
ncbi:MAG: hypothetical protein IAF94_04065 [Pirellulaceae bacterium]|nr:hypothetical protein [Pirellulaceae bacterium]